MEFPLTFGVQKTGLPLIVTSGKLKNMCFLIDTGSTHNTLLTLCMSTSRMNLSYLTAHAEQWA